jgi:hypothetical protein
MHGGQDGVAIGQWEMRMCSGCDSSPLSGALDASGLSNQSDIGIFHPAGAGF